MKPTHTILCVDDEQNVLASLNRLLRKEGYRILSASSGAEALNVIKENDVHLVIADHRMPEGSGIDFLAQVRAEFPDVIRIILTGFTDVDTITESINKGNIYRFFLKPWNDQNLKLEIRQALDQYDLMQANKKLHNKVLEKNEELKRINETLEDLVKERTKDLEIQNQALELSRAILEDLPLPIIGISAEGVIVLTNREAASLSIRSKGIQLGGSMFDCFPDEVENLAGTAMKTNSFQTIKECRFADGTYDIDCIPLSGSFRAKGVVMTLKASCN